jgi:hypothetical protein
MVNPDSSGGAQPYWGDHPSGLIIYTADGHVAAQLYDTRRPRLGVQWDRVDATAALTAFAGLATYLGRYAIDADASTITHTVEGAMAPDWIGSRLVRGYRFLGPDLVELRVITDAQGRRVTNGTVLVWERIGN